MAQTPREIVKRCLTFDNPERMPRHLWLLPWAETRFPEISKIIRERYPDDIIHSPIVYKQSPIAQGNRYAAVGARRNPVYRDGLRGLLDQRIRDQPKIE